MLPFARRVAAPLRGAALYVDPATRHVHARHHTGERVDLEEVRNLNKRNHAPKLGESTVGASNGDVLTYASTSDSYFNQTPAGALTAAAFEVDDLSSLCDGATTLFTLSAATSGFVNVELEGYVLREGATEDYTRPSTTSILMARAPRTGDNLVVKYSKAGSGDAQRRLVGVDTSQSAAVASGTYTDAGRILFPGTTDAGSIIPYMSAVAGANAGAPTFDVRVRDLTNAVTIAEATGLTGAAAVRDLLPITGSLPSGPADWAVQIRITGGGGNARVFSLSFILEP